MSGAPTSTEGHHPAPSSTHVGTPPESDDAGDPPDGYQTPVAPDIPDPVLACVDDASTPQCPLPKSQCVGGVWLAYFVDGQCVNGYCTWAKKVVHCQNTCTNGACTGAGGGFTASTPPPPTAPQ